MPKLTLTALLAAMLVVLTCTMPPLHPTVMMLCDAQGSGGSGVVVEYGWVLTAKHLPQIDEINGTPVTERFDHPDLDLSLLHAPGLRGRPVPIAATNPKLYDPLRAYGWHLLEQFMMTSGYQGKSPGEMSAPIIHGCSGGPVLNYRGELVGIISTVMYTGTGGGWDSYALPHISQYAPLDRSWIAKHVR